MQENLSTKPNKTFFWKISTLALTVIIAISIIPILIGTLYSFVLMNTINPFEFEYTATLKFKITFISIIVDLLAYYIGLSYGIGYIVKKSLIKEDEINKLAKWLTIISGLLLILCIIAKLGSNISLLIITIINYPIAKKILLKKINKPVKKISKVTKIIITILIIIILPFFVSIYYYTQQYGKLFDDITAKDYIPLKISTFFLTLGQEKITKDKNYYIKKTDTVNFYVPINKCDNIFNNIKTEQFFVDNQAKLDYKTEQDHRTSYILETTGDLENLKKLYTDNYLKNNWIIETNKDKPNQLIFKKKSEKILVSFYENLKKYICYPNNPIRISIGYSSVITKK